ncbi:MAG: MFS transporter [Ilumatobacter sp.]|uniref:MFS transporter n=1 Tax=Ilumatobacter sp. TaxID=1967498 RepID=UPI0032976C82
MTASGDDADVTTSGRTVAGHDGGDAPIGRRPASPRAILWAVGFSVFVAADDLTVVSTMLRPMIGDLGLVLPDGLDDAAWIVNAYLIAFIAVMPIAGRVSDVIGRRRTFMAAYATFMVGTIWIPLSDSLGPLLIGRVLTAIGGGAMVPVALAVVGDVYSEQRRARALGTLGAIETMGWVWGPLYGAMLVRFFSWRWQFWLNVPLAIAGAAAVWWALAEHDRPARRGRVDWLGAGLLTLVLVSLNLALLGSAEVQSVQGLDELTGNGGTDLRLLYPVAAAGAVAFVRQQRRLRRTGGDPIVDASLFRGRNVRVALIVNFVVGAGLVIAMVDVPLFVNAVERDVERSAVVAGWILSALTAAMAIASYVGGRVTERTWYGPPIALGLFAATGAYAVMGLTWDGTSSYVLLGLQLAVLGAGIGLTVAPTTSAVVDHAVPESRGAAAAVVMVVRMIGLSVGLSALTAWGLARFDALRGDLDLPAITDPGFGVALEAATEQLTAQSIADTFLASAVALGVGLAISLVLLRRPTRDSRSTPDAARPLRALHELPTEGSTHMDDDTRHDGEHDGTADDDEPAGDTKAGDPEAGDTGAGDTGAGDPVTSEHDTFVVPQRLTDTDEMPVIARDHDHDDDHDHDHDGLQDARAHESGRGWVHRNITTVVAAMGVLLLASLLLSAFMFSRVRATENELATTQEDLERVEAGAALFASQVNGFVETVNELGPSIDEGLDQAVTELEDFGSATIEFTVPIDQTITIDETFDLERTVTVPIETTIPIDEEVETTITINGPFGVGIPVDITVPVDLDIPIDLTVDIPIDESIPIDVEVPVELDVPISIEVEGTELETLTQSLIDGLLAFQEGLSGLTGG